MRKFTRLAGTLMIASAAMPAHADLLVFTDRSEWQAAVGGAGGLFEDFSAFVGADELYGQLPVNAGFVTFAVVGPADGSWRIDVPPATFSTIPTVNGTTFATVLGFSPGTTAFGNTRITFEPVVAFGFDYIGGSYGTADGVLGTSLGDSVTVPQLPLGEVRFLGLLYDGTGEVFDSLTFSAPEGPFRASTSMDNIEAYTQLCTGDDTDSDGVPDTADNCRTDANPDQRDTNGDGYGNACDADLNNDNLINFSDLGLLKEAFFSTGDVDSDFNGDQLVNFSDLGIMKLRFFGRPGPSCVAGSN